MWPAGAAAAASAAAASAAAAAPHERAWVEEWMARSAQKPAPMGGWTRTAVAARLARLARLVADGKRVVATGTDESEAERVAGEAERLMMELSDEGAVARFAHKERKRQRKERWVAGKRARRAGAEERREAEAALMERLVSEWQAVSRGAERERESAKAVARARRQDDARHADDARRRREHATRLAKIELLLAVRARRELQTRPRDDELRAFYEALPRLPLTEAASGSVPPPPPPPPVPPPAAPGASWAAASGEMWESHYGAAQHSVEALVDVRRRWDEHLSREGGAAGSCVPPYWLSAPRPSSSWRPHLIYAHAKQS